MTEFDPYDDEGNLRRAQQEVMAELTRAALERLYVRRPPVFAAPGDLHPDIAAWCDQVRQGRAPHLVLFGGTGSGKTWSLWKAAETLAAAGWRKRFDIVDVYEIKDATDLPVDDALVRRWKHADVLAIDDLGAQGLNGWSLDRLHPIVDHRWKHGLPIVVTTNVADMRAMVGERIASRLAGATLIRFTDTDHRRTA